MDVKIGERVIHRFNKSYYFSIPKAFINSEIIKPDKKYLIIIKEMGAKS